MPANTDPDDQDPTLPPPGRRWGAGAQSVLPFLTKTLQAKPASAPEPREAQGTRREREGPSFTPAEH